MTRTIWNAPNRGELWKGLQSRESRLIALRRSFHRHPELSLEEVRTAETICKELRSSSLVVTPGPLPTSVIAVVEGDKPGPTIAWRADIDALPIVEETSLPFASETKGVMHACGHDGHAAIAIVLAEQLAAKRKYMSGRAVFLFQPGEEIFAGAQPMIDAGVLDKYSIDRIYGLHLDGDIALGTVQAQPGAAMASADLFTLSVQGAGGHGASPHRAIDPIGVASQIVLALQSMLSREVDARSTAVLTIGEFHSGSGHNVIPEKAVLRGSLRTFDDDLRSQIIGRMDNLVTELARAHRTVAELTHDRSCSTLINNDEDAAEVRAWVERDLEDVDVECGHCTMASDDMSFFLQERPGCYLRVGAKRGDGHSRPHHSPVFDIAEASLPIACRSGLSVMVNALDGTLDKQLGVKA